VLADPDALPPVIRSWFPLLWHGTFARYRAVLVFRAAPRRIGRATRRHEAASS